MKLNLQNCRGQIYPRNFSRLIVEKRFYIFQRRQRSLKVFFAGQKSFAIFTITIVK